MYTIDFNSEEPIMLINKHIGMDAEDGMGIDGAAFQRELLQLDTMGKKRIQVYINCPGGNVIEGMSIVNAILSSKTPVDTYNVGIAASMGAAIFMAGRRRYIADYATVMVHNPSGGDEKTLNAFRDSLGTLMQSKCLLDEATVLSLMEQETWMGSAECLKNGFATDIEVTKEANKKWVQSTAKAMWKDANLIVNNIFKTDTKMKKVTAKLKLVEDANEDAILEAIVAVENKATEAEAALAAEKEEHQKLKDAQAASALKIETLEQAIKDNADAEVEKDALEMVTAFAKVGKIKNEAATIEKWKVVAKADMAGTKKMLEDLPLNKAAETIEKTEDGPVKVTAAMRMIEIQNRTNK